VRPPTAPPPAGPMLPPDPPGMHAAPAAAPAAPPTPGRGSWGEGGRGLREVPRVRQTSAEIKSQRERIGQGPQDARSRLSRHLGLRGFKIKDVPGQYTITH